MGDPDDPWAGGPAEPGPAKPLDPEHARAALEDLAAGLGTAVQAAGDAIAQVPGASRLARPVQSAGAALRAPAGARDTAGDGLTDAEEARWGTQADNWDSDGDRVSDREEVRVRHSNPKDADSDDDDVSDGIEQRYGRPGADLDPRRVARPPGAGSDFRDPILHPQVQEGEVEVWDDPSTWRSPSSMSPRPPEHLPADPPKPGEPRASLDDPPVDDDVVGDSVALAVAPVEVPSPEVVPAEAVALAGAGSVGEPEPFEDAEVPAVVAFATDDEVVVAAVEPDPFVVDGDGGADVDGFDDGGGLDELEA